MTSSNPEAERTKTQLAPLVKLATKHPAFTLAAVSAIGYLATSGYYAGARACLGTPFRPTLGTAEYLATFITFTAFGVAAAFGIVSSASVVQHVDKKPRLSVLTGLAGVAILAAMCVLMRDRFVVMVSTLVLFALCCLATRIAIQERTGVLFRILCSGLSLLLAYAAIISLGWYQENSRSTWLVATLNSQHFVVVGYTQDSLVAAPLVSTNPPAYVKQFRRISQDEPGLTLQHAKFGRMDRRHPDPIEIDPRNNR